MARFHGADATEEDDFYKNYRAFYGGATPSVNKAAHMGQVHKEQQKTLLRNKLAETAKRILNTKNFDDGYVQPSREKTNASMQSEMLKDAGFDAQAALKRSKDDPASYLVHKSTGQAAFTYARNPKIDKVTKMDPDIKPVDKRMRYNIITGSLQDWY